MDEKNLILDLSKFKKKSQIGSGGFGNVYIIEEKQTKKVFAAKLSKILLTEKNETYLQHSREVNIIIKIDHPSILKFIGYSPVDFRKKKFPVIVTEFESNGSLDYILQLEREGKAPEYWNDTKKLINIYGIACGMAYLHSNRILHRDLKPQNILEDDYLFPKIADFGLSKLYHENKDSLTSQSADGVKGTFLYIAPEVWKSEKNVKASDVYSFAIIVHEIMTGELPFCNMNNCEILYKVVSNGYRPQITHPIGESYKKLITRCWSADPNDRPTFDEIVKELKSDPGYITDKVDKDDYYSYVNYIDQYHSTFNPQKRNIKLNDITKRHSKTFIKVNLNPFSNNENDDFLRKIESFSELSEETQKLFEKMVKNNQATKKEITILYNDTNTLYCNGSLSSPHFTNVLKYFEEISIEINDQSTIFQSIFTTVLQIKQTSIQNIKIAIVLNGKQGVDSRFSWNNYINSVHIRSPVPTIEKRSFSDCLLLRELSICSTVKTIGEFAFSNCISLKKVEFNASIETIENGLFSGCSSLREITVPVSVTKIGSYSFHECTSIEKVVMPSSVTVIENSAFYECNSLKDVSLSSSLETIGENAFYGCSSLKKLTIPNSVKVIKSRAFYKCTSLSEVTIPNSVKQIESFTFKECGSIEKVSLGESIESIGDSSFFGCFSLRKISIPSSVRSIGDSCFYGCSALFDINIPSSVETIGDSCFYGCSTLFELNLQSSLKSIQNETFSKCSSLKKISIPSSVKTVGWYAFNGCSSLETVFLPSSIELIGGFSFQNCLNLREISIPSSVTKIPNSAFLGCMNLEKFEINSSVQSIGDSSFKDCSKLVQILIPSSVKMIGNSSFFGCTKLERISIPSSIKSIGDSCFYNCTNLDDVLIPSSVESIGNSCFFSCTKLERIEIQQSSKMKIICKETFSRCSSLKKFVIPNSVIKICEAAFFRCSLLEQIFIPSSVTTIENSCFSRCSSLREISIPSSVTSIGNECFSKCYSLTDIKIPSSVSFIGEKAFLGCTSITDLSIPSSIKFNMISGFFNKERRKDAFFTKEEVLRFLKIDKKSKFEFS